MEWIDACVCVWECQIMCVGVIKKANRQDVFPKGLA